MRLIDADALKKSLLEKGFYPAIVKRAIEDAPTVEATLPVVRCRECRNFWKTTVGWYCRRSSCKVTPMDYCSRSERKKVEDG